MKLKTIQLKKVILNNVILLFVFFSLLIFSACEIPKEEPPAVDPSKHSAVDVRNENSGFDSIVNVLADLAGVGGIGGDIGVYDFTLESNNNFNFVWSSYIPYQQGKIYSSKRLTYNLLSKGYVPLPSRAGTSTDILNLNNQERNTTYSYFYKPFSNFFTYCKQSEEPNAFGTRRSGSFGCDFSAEIPISYSLVGNADMGFLYPMINTKRFYIANDYDHRTGGFTFLGAPQNLDLYLYKSCGPHKYEYSHARNVTDPAIVANLLDISYVNKSRNQAASSAYTFDLRSDSLFAHLIFDTTYGNGTEANYIKNITGIAVANGLSNNSIINAKRHYSTDGKIIGMFFRDETTKQVWTYSFDYTTHTFTKGLENATLSYSAEGSDIDFDEFGNVYYTGVAGNGSNSLGVSVYKKDINGSTTIVGSDNFLKYGEIIRLKYLFGKVYLAVKGNITGTTVKQLTFLKQQ